MNRIKGKKGQNTTVERFLSYFKQDGENCWNWTGALFAQGYGCIGISGGKVVKAHRFSYEHFIGQIPEGKLVCHKCDNKKCINPGHLFLGSHHDNNLDCVRKGRHPLIKKGVLPEQFRKCIGSLASNAKLNEEIVKDVRKRLRNEDSVNMRDVVNGIIRDYGLKRDHISSIKTNRIWRHVS